MGNIVDKGPNIILIKDTKGYIFGGFASTCWTVGPQFSGDQTLIKNKCKCFGNISALYSTLITIKDFSPRI